MDLLLEEARNEKRRFGTSSNKIIYKGLQNEECAQHQMGVSRVVGPDRADQFLSVCGGAKFDIFLDWGDRLSFEGTNC
jgi:hypothetical protein